MSSSKKVFLFGAGGMGMAPLGIYLANMGFSVEAYDDFFREPLRSQLEESGVQILNEPVPLKRPDLIIRSSAVSEDDPRLLPFRKLIFNSTYCIFLQSNMWRRGDTNRN